MQPFFFINNLFAFVALRDDNFPLKSKHVAIKIVLNVVVIVDLLLSTTNPLTGNTLTY